MLRGHAARRLARWTSPLGATRGAAHHAVNPSAAQKRVVLEDLQAVLQDPQAADKLGAFLTPATTRNLTYALATVKRQQQQTQAARNPVEAVGAAAGGVAASSSAAPATISMHELKYVALQQGLPFIGFGFVDNAIMIIAGDYIDLTLGVSLGISSMAAAGIGNTISDIAGLGLGGVVEDFCARLGLPTPALTPAQMMLKETRMAKVAGSSIGVTIGCLLGMLPLLFLETRDEKEAKDRQHQA
ncbi:hypothetical protein P43SY_003725 [Pythium insidiosum]|uniref:Transmembrane protein 65 n=1 Tax=Pythium insidiosum TaxID=114742 RepID=A0AAD5Q455_PYTIN|nr:hypothetical protein P43SY_003725 [Pythium insidiosum]